MEYNRDDFLKTVPEKSRTTFKSFLNVVDKNVSLLTMSEQEILNFINEYPKWSAPATRNKQVKMFVALHKHLEKPYAVLQAEVDRFRNEQAVEQTLENRVVERVEPLIEKWRNANGLSIQDKLALGACLFRLNVRTDIAKCKYGKHDDADKVNHYDDLAKEFKYYTLNKKGETFLVISAPDEIVELIERLSLLHGENLFKLIGTDESKSNWFSKTIIKVSKQVFGREYTVTELRKITESNANVDATPAQILENAERNGHSFQTANRVYLGRV